MSKNNTEYATITVHFKGNKFKSLPLDVTNDAENRELVTTIADIGTDKLSMFKMPLTDVKFLVFSRKQLDECLFEIEVKPKTTRGKKAKEPDMITS